jgi:ubiquinone/menaquinone biosynthesis C-methylase UbiE
MTTDDRSTEQAPLTEGRTIRWFARFYDPASWLMSLGQDARANREIIAAAAVRSGERILDVGCGTGAQTIVAARAAAPAKVVGIDPSPEMLEVARRKAAKRGLDIDFRVAAIEHLPFGDAQFDVVLSGFMLHHLPEVVIRSGIAEVRRVLTPGGRFLAVDMVSGRSLLGGIIGLFGHAHKPQGLELIEEVMRQTGFREVKELPSPQKHVVYLLAS